MNFFRYINIARKVYSEISIQKQFNKTFLIPYLNELEKRYNGKFQPEQRGKILKYYGLFITSFLCSSYKRLYGKVLSNEERKRATLFGILTPVGDDLFDIDKLDNESIQKLTFHPETFNATTFSSHVAKEIQTYLLQTVPHTEEYIEASKNVLDIQVETIKQTNPDILKEEMRRITYTKGAVSVIIYHQCLDEAADAQMQEVLFFIGSLYQLGNDIFDLYKDVRDNIYTLINTCDDYNDFKAGFIERIKLQNEKIYALPYAKKDKEDFCIVMNTINARSLVAIDQFIKTQKQIAKKVDWWRLQRKDMIVDMEKPRNILKWLKYIYTLPNGGNSLINNLQMTVMRRKEDAIIAIACKPKKIIVTSILVACILFFNIKFIPAQNRDSLIHTLLLNIASMQMAQDGEFYTGTFPGFRQCAGAPHNYQPDNNIFYTAVGAFALRNMLPYLKNDDREIAEKIIANTRKAYPLYRNKHGYPYYGFWANGDPIQPHSYIYKYLKQVFGEGEDADDAVMILMTDSAGTDDVAALKKRMEDVSNLSTPNRKIISTYNRYKNIPAYSTYLGSRTVPDFDFAVQCNLLYFVLDKKLPFVKQDSATLHLITEMVRNREYMTRPVFLSPYYVRSPVLIYHVVRLMSAFHIPELEVYKQQLTHDAQQEFDKSPNALEKILLSTSLMRLGANAEVPPFESIDEFENSNQKDFVFFQARAAFDFPSFLKTVMLHFSYMNYYFYSPAYYKILWLENLVISNRN